MYEITAVPAETPETNPVVPLAVAIEDVALDHVPPEVALERVVVDPTQASDIPPIDAGFALTVTVAVARQPVDTEYDMVDVPGEFPVTIPELPIVATPVLLLDHVPPVVELASVCVEPLHIEKVPVIADGTELTDMS